MNAREKLNRRLGWSGAGRAGRLLADLLIAGSLAVLVPTMWGCARQSTVEAENREVRLTQDGVTKFYPRFSPDGAWIAYAANTGLERALLGVFLVPRQGGEARKLTPDTVAASPIGWSSDGKGVYCRRIDGHGIYYIGLDGSVRLVDAGDAISRTVAISSDGRTMLVLKFNKDNRDLGMRKIGGEFEFLAATPAWEEEAILGPGPGEVTVVSTPSYQAPTSTISIWSPKTRTLTALPLPEGQKSQPAWSVDGRLLAYTYMRDGQADLWLYDAKSARSAPLTDDPENSTSPSWAPDGEWIAFCRSTQISHVFVGHPMKEGRRQLTDGPDYDFSPAVSPDGQWVAFLRRFAKGATRGKPVLCVTPMAGGPVSLLELKGLEIPSKSGEALVWSPDSREIAFQANEGAAKMDIYRIGRDGRGLSRVTVEPGDEVEPHWSPDGQYISYTRVGGGQTRVAIVPASGGLPRTMGQEGIVSEGGAWSPKSDRLVYVSFRPDGTFELWMSSLAAAQGPTRLLESKMLAWPLDWSRDGKEIVLLRGQGTDWYVASYSLETHQETKVGRYVMLPTGKGMYFDFSPGAERYSSIIYPRGIVLADGQDRSDLYLIRARIPGKLTALSIGEDRSLWSGYVGLAGCF